jgi:addiction module RelE/StbE family toxin
MNNLKEAMLLLIENAAPLPAEWLDHPLTGQWTKHRDCHIGGDFLFVTACKHNSQDLQTSVFSARINCEYPTPSARIK